MNGNIKPYCKKTTTIYCFVVNILIIKTGTFKNGSKNDVNDVFNNTPLHLFNDASVLYFINH